MWNLVILNEFPYRIRNKLWLQLQRLQSDVPVKTTNLNHQPWLNGRAKKRSDKYSKKREQRRGNTPIIQIQLTLTHTTTTTTTTTNNNTHNDNTNKIDNNNADNHTNNDSSNTDNDTNGCKHTNKHN